jgi:SAM-dependent methyltransferase
LARSNEEHARPGLESLREHTYREYADAETIGRYRRSSAGEGIDYLLRTTYRAIFLESALAVVPERDRGLRLLEFGCGAGMALHQLAEDLHRENVPVELAVGTDLVPEMIQAASQDLDRFGSAWAKERFRYVVAANEELVSRLSDALGEGNDEVTGTFQLAVGVNTFRYAIRHGTDVGVVEQLKFLLSPGGRVVMIDMNDAFPYGLKPRRRSDGQARGPFSFRLGTEKLPTLDRYEEPFRAAGFEVLRTENFCWIPHSANRLRFRLARAASPVLDRIAQGRAMRSLVVARRP